MDGLALRDEPDLGGRSTGSCQAGRPAISTRPDDGWSRPGEQVEEGRLAGAVRAEQAGDPGPEAKLMSLTATTLPYQRETRVEDDRLVGRPERAAGATPGRAATAGVAGGGRCGR